jgi:SagB-type dehydrogenase family enzyme
MAAAITLWPTLARRDFATLRLRNGRIRLRFPCQDDRSIPFPPGGIMKALCPVLALVMLASATVAQAADTTATASVTLPAAKITGTVPVEKALKERRSVRAFAPGPLTLEEVGQLCWAAQGVTDDKGHRTAPSAMATYPLELYVIAGEVTGLPAGIYHYEPATHSLTLRSAGDQRAAFREKVARQDWIATVPAIFVISGVPEKMGRMQDRGSQFLAVEVGLAAQGFFLQETALGLGSTFVGGFDPAGARTALGLPTTEDVIAVLPVGRKL